MPNVIKGNDLMLYTVANGIKTAICYAKGCTLNINRDTKEITGRGLNGWRDYITGKAGYTIDVNGNMNAVPGNGKTLLSALLNGDRINFWFTDNVNFEWSGILLVNSATIDSQMDALATFSNTLIGKGKLQYKELSTSNQQPDQNGSEGKPTLTGTDLESFFDTIIFTYDGMNNNFPLAFTPIQVQGGSVLNNKPISPAIDYYFNDASVTLNHTKLIEGVEYNLTIFYFK